MYVVSITGKNVFQNGFIVCTIAKISNLDKVRVYIKQRYGVEFETLSTQFTSSLWHFNNITDDRDITLVVENVYTEDDIEFLLS